MVEMKVLKNLSLSKYRNFYPISFKNYIKKKNTEQKIKIKNKVKDFRLSS